MDRIEQSPRPSGGHEERSWSHEPARPDQSLQAAGDHLGDRPRLALVRTQFALAAPPIAPDQPWADALAKLTDGLGIALEWSVHERQPSLMDRARQVIGSSAEAGPPVFAPWQCWSPTVFQGGLAAARLPRARWVASYLFDSGIGRPRARRTVDVVLMSPLPAECEGEDAASLAGPRLGVLKAMLGAAHSEGRSKLAIIVREAQRNAMAALLVAACDAAVRPDLEILSIEQAVVRIQANEIEWDAIIVMPDLRGIVHAMLSGWSGVSAPWPMLWHEREIVLVTSEGIARPAQLPLDASLLMHALALAARKRGCGAVAEGLHARWAALRDRAVATPSRPSPTPYAHAVSEADFIAVAIAAQPQAGRALPGWTGIASGCPAEMRRMGAARFALVASR